jgi:hypothetical protein
MKVNKLGDVFYERCEGEEKPERDEQSREKYPLSYMILDDCVRWRRVVLLQEASVFGSATTWRDLIRGLVTRSAVLSLSRGRRTEQRRTASSCRELSGSARWRWRPGCPRR